MKQSIQIRRVVRNSIRMYFAPLTGAFKGIRSELHRADRENERSKAKQASVNEKVEHRT